MINGRLFWAMAALVVVSACGDGASHSIDIYEEVAEVSARVELSGVNHSSSTAPAMGSHTGCREALAAPEEEALRAEYTLEGTGICKRDRGFSDCRYARVLSDSAVTYSERVNEAYAEELIVIAFRGQLHSWIFHRDINGPRSFHFANSQDSMACDPSASYEIEYGADDLEGEFEAVAYRIGLSPPFPEEVARDNLTCTGEVCTGSNGLITLTLPRESFDLWFEGYLGGPAVIAGTDYGSVLGNVAPSKDRATFAACPSDRPREDSVEVCRIVVLERRT
ncbi:MAG: hypothetical protein VYC42_04930 [Pseudomonadota bacterium]|nr:hypothetical protein [Pseudomonadota bacterium]